jgi:hypothetical protein
MLDLYLIPRFGEQMVVNVSRSDVVLMSRELLLSGGAKHQGLAPKTVNSVLSLMKNIMEYGSREKGITIADITDIAVKQPQKPMRILTREEQAKLSKYLRSNLTDSNLGTNMQGMRSPGVRPMPGEATAHCLYPHLSAIFKLKAGISAFFVLVAL